jgi:hypothetical protein
MKIIALLLGLILTIPLSIVIMTNLFGGGDKEQPDDKKGCVACCAFYYWLYTVSVFRQR